MSEPSARKIGLFDIARGALSTLPHSRTVLEGAFNLLRADFGKHFSLGGVLEAQAQRYPDACALKFEDQSWTYAQFNAWVNRLAHTLALAGVRKGDVVALLMENHANALALVAALAKLGAIAGLLNTNQRGDALRHSVRTLRAARLVIAAECAEAFADLGETWDGPLPFWLKGQGTGRCPKGWFDLARRSRDAEDSNPGSTGEVDIADPCFYILTSGTTSMPKASVMSHRRWLRGMAGVGQMALRLKPGDVLYCALPLYHNNALTVSWGATLGTGAALAIDRKFSASRFFDRVRHFDASAFTYIGELCRYLLAQPESPRDRQHRLRACIGNGLRPEIWQAFKTRFGIQHVCEFYGASESNLAFINALNVDETAGYCPMTYAVVEYDAATAGARRSPQGRLVKVKSGGTGLLVTAVTKRLPFDGYTDKSASESKMIRDAFKRGDCWFNTGDLVRDQGWKHIQFVDRLGDTFRWKGENVATTEVEAAVQNAPGVAEATVYGVQVPNMDGRAGMTALRMEGGHRVDTPEFAAHLRQRLPAYAVPVFLRLVAALEATATFKTRKQQLREEGCDPGKVGDPLYVWWPGANVYSRLDEARWGEIESGKVKL